VPNRKSEVPIAAAIAGKKTVPQRGQSPDYRWLTTFGPDLGAGFGLSFSPGLRLGLCVLAFASWPLRLGFASWLCVLALRLGLCGAAGA
jgi:hypothetical protein